MSLNVKWLDLPENEFLPAKQFRRCICCHFLSPPKAQSIECHEWDSSIPHEVFKYQEDFSQFVSSRVHYYARKYLPIFWIFVTSSNQIKFPIKTISFMIMVNLKFYLQFAMEGGSKVFCRCDPLMEPSSVSVVIILLKSSEMLLELIPILRYVPDLVDKKDERDLKRLLYYASQKQLSSLLMWKTHVLFQVLYQKWQCRMWYSIFRCHCYEFSLEAWEMLLDFFK